LAPGEDEAQVVAKRVRRPQTPAGSDWICIVRADRETVITVPSGQDFLLATFWRKIPTAGAGGRIGGKPEICKVERILS
jgi:hypothetical protein